MTFYKTTNGGASWTPIFTGTDYQKCMAVGTDNPNIVYAAEPLVLRKSIDGGTTWNAIGATLPVTGSSPITSIAVSTLDVRKIWVALSGLNSGNNIFSSPDGGNTWTNISGHLPGFSVNCIAVEPGSTVDALYLGTDKGVFYHDNTLNGWVSFSAGLPSVIVNDFYINVPGNKIAAATFGRGVWTSSLYLKPCFPFRLIPKEGKH
jgi:xyloglucan-specific exo-beta-1,4-glucanase